MGNQIQQETQPIPPITPVMPTTPAITPQTNWYKVSLFVLLGLIVVGAGSVFIGIQIGKNQNINLQPIVAQPPATPMQIAAKPTTTPNSSPSTNPTTNWKQYTSPEVGDYFSPFQISYPSTWTLKQEFTSEEPKSLTITLKNAANDTIKIIQAMGGGGSCIYYDDSDYTTFDGMGQFFSSFTQLTKPALWRISQNKDKNTLIKTVCEKTKERYIDGTRIGWINIDTKSETSMEDVKLILESVVFKPTANTKTLFD